MTLRDDLARVVAERRAANPRNEPGHVDYGISDAVLSFIEGARLAERERVTRIIREQPPSFQLDAGFRLDPNQPVARFDYLERESLLVALGVGDNQPGTTP